MQDHDYPASSSYLRLAAAAPAALAALLAALERLAAHSPGAKDNDTYGYTWDKNQDISTYGI